MSCKVGTPNHVKKALIRINIAFKPRSSPSSKQMAHHAKRRQRRSKQPTKEASVEVLCSLQERACKHVYFLRGSHLLIS